MKVYLYGLRQFALIVPIKTGVVYAQQTAGVCCNQREIEGSLYPLEVYGNLNSLGSIMGDAYEVTDGLADECDAVFQKFRSEWSIDIRVDRTKMAESEEAWLWVTVHDLWRFSIEGLPSPFSAVLTWENSD